MKVACATLAACLVGGSTAWAQSDPIYDENVVASFYFTLPPAAWNLIVNDPDGAGDQWQRADMTWNNGTVTDTVVGVGLKASGEGRPVGFPKPSLRLSFNEFEFGVAPERKWRGVKRIKFEANYDDDPFTLMRERLAMWTYRKVGVPAPRACHARIYVNGVYKGLYAAVEPPRGDFTEYRWGEDSGNMYRVHGVGNPPDSYLWRGSSPSMYVPTIFEPEMTQTGGTFADVVTLVDILNNGPPANRRTRLEGHINLDGFLRYVAVSSAIVNTDSIILPNPQEHYWYHRTVTNRMEVIPWDCETSFDALHGGTQPPPPETGIWERFDQTVALSWIDDDAVATASYKAKLRETLAGPFSEILQRLDFVYAQIRSHVYADTNRWTITSSSPWAWRQVTSQEFDSAVAALKLWITRRIQFLQSSASQLWTDGAGFVSHTVPLSMTAGQVLSVSVTMRNTGETTWSGDGTNRYGLGHPTPPPGSWIWRERRVWLAAGETVAPNQSKTFVFTITAPSTPGSYVFPQWRMVKDGIGYFGTSLPALTLTVTGGTQNTVTKSFQQGLAPTAAYAGARDAHISQDAPATNFGSAASLTVDGDTTGGNDARALLRWYVTDIPPGSTVQSARIVLSVTNPSTQVYELYRVYRYWSESQVTWNQSQTGTAWQVAGADGSGDRGQSVRGAVTAGATGSVTIVLNSSGVSMVQAWVNDPGSNFGVILLDAANTDGLAFASKEAATASQRSRLEVTYTAPAVAGSLEEIAPADSVIDGGENPLTLEDALAEAAVPQEGGGAGASCGLLGLEALLFLLLFAAFCCRGRSKD